MKYLLITCLLSWCSPVFSQKSKDEFYLWNAAFSPVSVQDSAVFFTHVVKINDTCWQWDTYLMYGPMITSEQYFDHDGKILHGTYHAYKRAGVIDSSGSFNRGLQDGTWSYLNDTGRYVMQRKYDHGKLLETIDLLKPRTKEEIGDTTHWEEKESEFRGGQAAWANYLTTKLRYPDRALKMEKQGMVVVQFIVDKEGKTQSVEIYKSVEFSLDEEAKRILIKSPNWIPARQDGRIVKSYKRQPIMFALQ